MGVHPLRGRAWRLSASIGAALLRTVPENAPAVPVLGRRIAREVVAAGVAFPGALLFQGFAVEAGIRAPGRHAVASDVARLVHGAVAVHGRATAGAGVAAATDGAASRAI